MKFTFKVNIADVEVEIESEAKNNKDVLRQVAFYSELPKEGPTGNKNLMLSHRTPKGFEYFSIIDKEAGKEFSFGTSKETGELFCKGWKDAYIENRVDRSPEPNLEVSAEAKHDASMKMKEAKKDFSARKEEARVEAGAPPGSKNMADVLAKYGLGK